MHGQKTAIVECLKFMFIGHNFLTVHRFEQNRLFDFCSIGPLYWTLDTCKQWTTSCFCPVDFQIIIYALRFETIETIVGGLSPLNLFENMQLQVLI